MECLWQFYTDMNIPGGLSPITKLFHYLSFSFACFVALAGIAGLVKESLVRNRRVTLVINATHLLCLTALHQIFLAAMYLPLLEWIG